MAGLFRVRCWTHGVLEHRSDGAWAAAWATYDEARTMHNKFVTGGRHGPTCRVDIEKSDDHGLTWKDNVGG